MPYLISNASDDFCYRTIHTGINDLINISAVNAGGPEDQEVASVTASLTSTITDSTSVASVDSNSHIPYHFLDRSADNNSLGGDYNSIGKGSLDNKSDTDVLLQCKWTIIY